MEDAVCSAEASLKSLSIHFTIDCGLLAFKQSQVLVFGSGSCWVCQTVCQLSCRPFATAQPRQLLHFSGSTWHYLQQRLQARCWCHRLPLQGQGQHMRWWQSAKSALAWDMVTSSLHKDHTPWSQWKRIVSAVELLCVCCFLFFDLYGWHWFWAMGDPRGIAWVKHAKEELPTLSMSLEAYVAAHGTCSQQYLERKSPIGSKIRCMAFPYHFNIHFIHFHTISLGNLTLVSALHFDCGPETVAAFYVLGLDSGADIIVCVPPSAYAAWLQWHGCGTFWNGHTDLFNIRYEVRYDPRLSRTNSNHSASLTLAQR